jgi:hypothetical protein
MGCRIVFEGVGATAWRFALVSILTVRSREAASTDDAAHRRENHVATVGPASFETPRYARLLRIGFGL